MSYQKSLTLTVQTLNKLYFQFFNKHVLPYLSKSILEIDTLLRTKNSLESYRYLQELFKGQVDNDFKDKIWGGASEQISRNDKNSSFGVIKSGQKLGDSISFNRQQNKKIITLKSLDFEQKPDHYSFQTKIDQQISNYSNKGSSQVGKYEFKTIKDKQIEPKEQTNYVTHLNHCGSESQSKQLKKQQEEVQQYQRNNLKEMLKKMISAFAENHNKIDKYNGKTNESMSKNNEKTSVSDDSRYFFQRKPQTEVLKY